MVTDLVIYRTVCGIRQQLGALYVESWAYSSCLNVLDNVEHWTSLVDSSAIGKINWFKGTLYELARAQVGILVAVVCSRI